MKAEAEKKSPLLGESELKFSLLLAKQALNALINSPISSLKKPKSWAHKPLNQCDLQNHHKEVLDTPMELKSAFQSRRVFWKIL